MDIFKELTPVKKIGMVATAVAGLATVSYATYSFLHDRHRSHSKSKHLKTNTRVSVSENNEIDHTGMYSTSRNSANSSDNSNDKEREQPKTPSENIDNETHDKISAQIGEEKKVLVLGMERSGKTCLLSALLPEVEESSELVDYEPTQGFNVVCISSHNLTLSIWEIGGSEKYRGYWTNFLHGTNLLMFVVDSSNIDLLPQVKEHLLSILEQKEIEGVPLLVVLTKADIDSSLSTTELYNRLELNSIKDRQVELFSVQLKCGGAAKSEGVDELHNKMKDLC